MILKRNHPEHWEIECSVAEISHWFIAVSWFKDWETVDRITYSVSNEPEIDETIQVEKKRPSVVFVPGENEWDPAIPTTVLETYYEEEKTGKRLPNPNYVDTSSLKNVYEWLWKQPEFVKNIVM